MQNLYFRILFYVSRNIYMAPLACEKVKSGHQFLSFKKSGLEIFILGYPPFYQRTNLFKEHGIRGRIFQIQGQGLICTASWLPLLRSKALHPGTGWSSKSSSGMCEELGREGDCCSLNWVPGTGCPSYRGCPNTSWTSQAHLKATCRTD